MARLGWASAVYLGAAVLVTWPLVLQLSSQLGAPVGTGDTYLNLWTISWGVRCWLEDPAGVLAGRAFDAPIFHPATLTLTYSDHQLVQALAVTPVVAAGGGVALAYNLVLLLSIAASGLAMHVLARNVTGSTPAAFVAGLAWACWPYRTAHLIHLQLQALYLLPLAVWALLRVAAGRRWLDAFALGLWSGLQAVVSVYYGVMTAVVLIVCAPLVGWTTGQWRRSRYVSRVSVAAVISVMVVLPIAGPYLRAKQMEGFGRTLEEASAHAAGLASYAQVPPSNLVYGRSGLLAPRAPQPGQTDRRHVEQHLFPGLVLSMLAIAGAWVGCRSNRRVVTALGVSLVVVGVWLSLGPGGPLGVYAWLATHVFGFDAIRAPARFAVVAQLGLAVLAAVAMSLVRLLGRPAVATLVALLLVAEYVNAPLAFTAAPPMTSPIGRWLRDAPEPGTVLYWPIPADRENTRFMIAALEHRRPIVNGYSGQEPRRYPVMVRALSSLDSIEARALLEEVGVRFVVSSTRLEADRASGPQLVERAALDGQIIYEVRR